MLTGYNGVAFSYDAVGNPTRYYNGNNFRFNWSGRRMNVIISQSDGAFSFTYDDNGLRKSKIAVSQNNLTTYYHYDGSRLFAEENSAGEFILYVYDGTGSVIGMQYRNYTYIQDTWDVYWFDKNLQGDIVGIYNYQGTLLVSYTYDAWGNFTTTYHNGGENTSATKNPFTYRGYYYDRDFGFYYLNSRYYDPIIKRFINPDNYDTIAVTPLSLTDKNLYAYCDNNPVSRRDDGGEFWHIIVGAVVGAAVSAISTAITNVVTGKEWHEGVAVAAVAGAASGALASTGVGVVGQVVGSAAISAGESFVSQGLEKGFDKVDYSEVAFDAVIGGISGRKNGLPKGTAKHLMDQGVNATKKILTTGQIKTALKEYASSNYDVFYKNLINGIPSRIKSSVRSEIRYELAFGRFKN